MQQKIEQAVEKIKTSSDIEEHEKPLILEKIEEWKEEKAAISDLTNALEGWWLKVEPIFAEIGLV
jgi:hypothetical protein